jgi:hypothetical protein
MQYFGIFITLYSNPAGPITPRSPYHLPPRGCTVDSASLIGGS